MAGYRAAFIVGDPKLIDQIRQIRKHAGLMVDIGLICLLMKSIGD